MLTIKIAQWVLRISAIIVLVLGILFWTNVHRCKWWHRPRAYVAGYPGCALLWTLGIAQGLRGGSFGIAMATFIWGLLTLAVGLFQTRWLPGLGTLGYSSHSPDPGPRCHRPRRNGRRPWKAPCQQAHGCIKNTD